MIGAMNVLVLGVNGFLGSAVASCSLAKGHRVFGMSRSDVPNLDANITYLRGNRSDHGGVVNLISERKIDVVVDVIPMTVADTQPLIDCLDDQVNQYVMVSSSDVYRNYELFQGKAKGNPTLDAVSEDAELRQTRFPYRGQKRRTQDAADQYLDDYDKILVENAVRRMSSSWTILRLPMVYGAGDKHRRFRWAIKPMAEGEQELVIPSSWANWCSTYGYIENVAAAIALTLGHPKAENRVFNVGERQSVSQLEWATRFANVLGWTGVINQTDDPDTQFARRIGGLDLTVPFKVSSSRIREELGFRDAVGQTQALVRTVASETSV